jgi:aryl-alcohol dehydrogenase-like predicted oxidoreductase
VLRRAVELGVNFIDTAYSYGPEVNERLIAEALHPYPTDLLIATKTGFQRGGRDDWRADCRPRTLRADCERSLRLLRLERLHLLQLHTVDPNVPIEESMGALAELQREGKVDHVGVSNVDIDQLARARAVTTVVSVQNRYSILARGGEDVLGVCERDHLAFIPWFPLGAGAVGTTLSLDQVASRHKATRFQIAIAWLLRRSPVVLPIPGTASVVHLEENMAAARIELSDDDLSLLAAIAS